MRRVSRRQVTRQDRADMEALRSAPRDEERIQKASREFRRWQEQKKAGKLPPIERVGKAR